MPEKKLNFLKKNRLTLKADYAHLFKHGKKLNQGGFLVLYLENHKDYSRIGVIVAKRYVKKAVLRNTIKRVTREGFRLKKNDLIGLDVVLLLRHNFQSKALIREDLEVIWQRLTKYSATLSS